jgi:magnesium transporter
MAEHSRADQAASQLKLLSQALDSGRLGPARRLVNTLAPAEIAALLETLPHDQRLIIWGLVDPEDDGEVLVHVNDEVRESLISDMDTDELVAAAETLDVDDLADLIEDLPDHLVDEVLRAMDRENRDRVEQVLSYPEDTAGRLMNPELVTVRADVDVDVVLRYLRMRGELPDNTNHLYVVSRRNQYLGRVPLGTLVTADPESRIGELMDTEVAPIHADTEASEVARHFADHDLISAPVVDANNVLLGRITVDDVVDVIREEAEETVRSLAGLPVDEELFTPATRAVRRRGIWLGINLLTAFLAASVIGRFEEVLDQIVALAVLMPITASMGGNAGLQAMTLTVRGLALNQLVGANVRVLLVKEVLVGLMNGVFWATVVATAAYLWFGNLLISTAIGGAMVANLFFAALAGVLVPVTLHRMDIDPAIAGSVIVTTITDVMGFFAFLGLGTLLLLS